MPTTAGDLARSLIDFVDAQLRALSAVPDGPLSGLALPGMLMGHEVGPDVRADLLFTLGLLHECGQRSVGGVAVPDAITDLLAGVPGGRTHTFYSYRVAETVARFGAFEANPLLATLTDVQRAEVAQATDTMEWLPALDEGLLPRNYAAVLARCEHARRTLGLAHDDRTFDALLSRVRDLLGGPLDDSNAQIGRYDIYTVDIHLFCEPLAPLLGEPWLRGAERALDLVDRVATRDGAAVAWGRSTGVLATCHTIELAGLVARHGLVEDPARWIARAAGAAATLDRWFAAGWVTAHQHRSSDPYRGLDRRLQMTLDCLGKLADAAHALQRLAEREIDVDVDEVALFPPRDEMVWFDEERHAGVWSFRDAGTAFVLPLVGGSTTDYLPAPRNPGLYEVPVGSPLATGTPVVFHKGIRYAGGGLPTSVEHRPGELHATYVDFPEAGQLEPGAEPRHFAGRRDVTWTVDGRTLRVREQLRFPEPPHALGLQVAEPGRRPLQVRFDCDVAHTATTVDVDGIAEYRSCWSDLARVHQVDVTSPGREVDLRWSVTPMLRVASTAAGHLYGDSLYGPIADRVRVVRVPYSATTDLRLLDAFVPDIDQFHMHWPEWMLIGDVGPHLALIGGLRDSGVRIVWTQHNLEAHSKDPTMGPVYEAWAQAADLVIHHSEWGRDRALATYDYGDHTRHVVIAHGHFGDGARLTSLADRTAVEHDLGLRPGVLRIGIFGAPRAEKDVELAMRAVARSNRADVELLVLSLDATDVVPDDPRIVAFPYETVSREEYDRRLGAIDALLMPFDPEGQMLTTGTIGDALGFGIPTIASSWPFLVESLGEAAIVYGASEDDLVTCLERLDRGALAAAADAARRRRVAHEWSTIAEQTYAELDRLGSERH